MPKRRTKEEEARRPGNTLRLVTYNVHSCIGTSGALNMEKVAEVIEATGAQVAALQEIDAGKPRSGRIHQARWLAGRLGWDHRFFPVMQTGKEGYGLAVLSALPMETVRQGRLPAPERKKPREGRGAMWIRLREAGGRTVNLVNTHLGLRAAERRLQVEGLLGEEWLGGVSAEEPTILCGDFNAGRRSYVYRRICSRLIDVQCAPGIHKPPRATFWSFYPILCLDHIFVSDRITVLRAAVPTSRPARRASDHLPVVAELAFDPESVSNPSLSEKPAPGGKP